jgi:hypothetical protein
MSKYDWKFMKHIKGGHSYWMDGNTSRVAISDDSADRDGSGRYGHPDKTDDGVNWLDMSRPVTIKKVEGKFRCSIPLLDVEGEPTSSPVDLVEASYAVKTLGMRVLMESLGEMVIPFDELEIELKKEYARHAVRSLMEDANIDPSFAMDLYKTIAQCLLNRKGPWR